MAGSQNISRMSPRQRMINLMYIVLTAMLALNVSSDVLNGFNQVEDGLARTNVSISNRNADIYNRIAAFAEQNPEKGGVWYDKATKLRNTTDTLYRQMETLMIEIVKNADGESGDVDNINSLDDLESASYVMLSPTQGKGVILRKDIDRYRNYVTSLLTDSVKRNNIENTLSTLPQKENGTFVEKTWEETLFENMPVISAVTILRKLQSDVLYAEGEGLNALLNGIDAGDVRVNRVSAFVIPSSRNVMRGSKYSANIVLAAVDTTQRPTVVINGTELDNQEGLYEVVTSKTGTFDYSGYIEMPRGDGSMERQDFTSSYTVIEPMATVSATMMNVLYAGIDNPISIAVPGVASSNISASMTNGTLSRAGDRWVAKPAKVGTEAVVSVTANIDGRVQTVASMSFRVRKLPDPTPFIMFKDDKGNADRYKGGRPLSKALLLQSPGIEAAIDDDLLNINFQVVSFETVIYDSMGNAIPELSNGSQFSQRQKDSFRRLSRGKRFYITRVKAVGPDGIERIISPMEVIVN